MATKIRLQRHGKKGYPFYHVVVADSRAKRDGKFIEKLGTYNPNTNPATIDINFDQTLHWVKVGAEMSDTARAILSYKGVLYKNHLLKGLAKGALTEADVEKKFEAWLKEKASKIEAKEKGLSSSAEKAEKERLAAEKARNEARAAEIAAKNTPEVEEPVAEETAAEDAPKGEVETSEEAPQAEEKTAEETPKGEVEAEEESSEEETK
ncbi:MAG: 30S ribosomal protein S16 [Brumimicrobium sp.]|nr:30S ribosomal protein S16 [Brumimicrobium sp.]